MIDALNGRDVLMIAPGQKTATSSTTANLDTKDADWVTIRIQFAQEINTNAVGPTISLLESDDTTATNFATIIANRTDEDLVAAKELRYDVDTRRRKRYLRLSITAGTHTTNDVITISAIATLTRLTNTPSNAAALVESGGVAVIIT